MGKIILWILAVLLGLCILYILFLLFCALLVNEKLEYQQNSPFYRFLLYSATAFCVKLLRIHIHTEGIDKIPKDGRFLFVSNHRSNFDPILTWYVLKDYDLAFISKAENFRIPIFGRIIRKCCFMAIDRENPRNAIKTIEKAAGLIEKDEVSVAVYPEGTRSKECVLLPFHNGVFKIAQKANVPIVVAAIQGTEQIHKNYLRRRSDIQFEIVDMIPSDYVKMNRTTAISDRVRLDLSKVLTEKSKKILKVSGVAFAATAAASAAAYITTRYLTRVALDREEPKAFKKAGNLISGSESSNVFLEELHKSAEKLAEKDNETVEIIGHDGISLVGHWIPCENAKRVIIAMHGWRSKWYKDFGMVADFWEKNDCSVLYAEQRGQGNSGGDYIGFGPIERYDCLDWINWVTNRCGNEVPIYLCGVSMGATTVLMAADLALPDNVHGIIGDCGFTSPHAIWKHVAKNNLHITFGLRGIMADTIYERKTQTDAADESTVDALRNCSVPVMLIHGADDHFVPLKMTYENYNACASPKKLFIVPGADHGMSYFIDKEGYEMMVKDFWRQFD